MTWPPSDRASRVTARAIPLPRPMISTVLSRNALPIDSCSSGLLPGGGLSDPEYAQLPVLVNGRPCAAVAFGAYWDAQPKKSVPIGSGGATHADCSSPLPRRRRAPAVLPGRRRSKRARAGAAARVSDEFAYVSGVGSRAR